MHTFWKIFYLILISDQFILFSFVIMLQIFTEDLTFFFQIDRPIFYFIKFPIHIKGIFCSIKSII